MNLQTAGKILIIRLSSLGDVILSTPIFRAIKNKFPHLQIDFLVRQEFRDVVALNPNIHNLFVMSRDNDNEINPLINFDSYDCVIDLQNNIRSKILLKRFDKQVFRYTKPSFKKFLLVNFKINLLKDLLSIPERYVANIPGIELDGNGPEIYLPENLKTKISSGGKAIGLCPGSKHFTKMWPKEYWIELGNKLSENDFKVAILGGKADREICEEIHKSIKGSINLCTDDDLYRTAVEIKNCTAIATNDSGLMHVASAMKVSILSFFGSTVKEFGFTPYRVKNIVLENNSLTCRPCSHIGRSTCPKKHFNCMKEIKPETAFNKLLELVGE